MNSVEANVIASVKPQFETIQTERLNSFDDYRSMSKLESVVVSAVAGDFAGERLRDLDLPLDLGDFSGSTNFVHLSITLSTTICFVLRVITAATASAEATALDLLQAE